jgi:hypothetical protein
MTSTAAQGGVRLQVGVTAHSDLGGVDPELLSSHIREFFTNLQSKFPQLPLVLLTSLAQGGDSRVASIALEMGIPLEVPLPMPIDQYKLEFDDAQSLADFQRLCSEAVVYELPELCVADENELRSLQSAQLGTYISSHCQVLLALWDGDSCDTPGSPASVVHYHLRGEMENFSSVMDDLNLLADKESDLIYHIPCPRSGSLCKIRDPGWLNQSGRYPAAVFPREYYSAFRYMELYRQDVDLYAEKIAQEGDTLLDDECMRQDTALELIDMQYRSADWLANRYAKLVNMELAVTHVLAGFMGLCFILYSEYESLSYLLPGFLFIFFSAWFFNFLANKRQWHRQYLDNRALAEGLRVQFYWTLAGIEDYHGAAVAYDNLMQKQDLELVWIRHVIRNVNTAAWLPQNRLPNGPDLAIKHWIGDRESGRGQLSYYQRAGLRRERNLERTTLLGKVTLWCGIVVALLLFIAGQKLSDNAVAISLVLMGLFPLFAGIRSAYAFKKADKELTKQYQFMLKTFSRAQRNIGGTEDLRLKKRILKALGEACLEEHSEWLLTHRERPPEPSGLQS